MSSQLEGSVVKVLRPSLDLIDSTLESVDTSQLELSAALDAFSSVLAEIEGDQQSEASPQLLEMLSQLQQSRLKVDMMSKTVDLILERLEPIRKQVRASPGRSGGRDGEEKSAPVQGDVAPAARRLSESFTGLFKW